MTRLVYLDTSALAKWYLNEKGSDAVEAFLRKRAPVAISTLTIVEMRSLLGRRRREGSIDADVEIRVGATLEDDLREGHLVRHRVEDRMVESASALLAALSGHALRTLDALHLAVARAIGAEELATADRVMASAAPALGLAVARLG